VVTLNGGGTRKRRAAQSIIERLLRLQDSARPRSRWERLVGRSPLGRNCEGLYQGALGEIAVGARLKTLSTEWAVFHSLPIGLDGWDIDHILIGPGGIVTINTKHHRDLPIGVSRNELTVDGQPVPYLRHSEFEEEYVSTLLQDRWSSIPPIHPVVVFVAPREVLSPSVGSHVTVLDLKNLLAWLAALPVVLDESDRRGIVELFDNPAMWANTAVGTGDALLARFSALEAEIRAARRQRTVRLPLAALLAVSLTTAVVLVTLALLRQLAG